MVNAVSRYDALSFSRHYSLEYVFLKRSNAHLSKDACKL